MKHLDKVNAILTIRPNAIFTLNDDDLVWLDENQTQPTDKEIQAGWIAYQAAQETEAQAKATQKAALLERLGISEDEARLLLA
jgi:hypothetical protein